MAKREIITELNLREISAVDTPAQEGARMMIMKRKETQKKVWLTTVADGHQHVVNDLDWDGKVREGGDTTYAQAEGEDEGHSHPWIRNPDGTVTIGMANGHTHDVLPPQYMKMAAAESGTIEETDPMPTPAEELEEAKTKKAAADAAAAAATKRAERAEKVATLIDAEKAIFKALDTAGQDAFLAKTADERKVEVDKAAAKARETNPEVFKSADGTVYRQNDDPRMIALAKQLDASNTAAKTATEKAERTELEKRAADEMPRLPGSIAMKATVLKAIDGIADETMRTEAKALIKAGNDALDPAFKRLGVNGMPATKAAATNGTSPQAKLDALAKTYAETNKVSIEKAQTAVLKTKEGSDLYTEIEASKTAAAA